MLPGHNVNENQAPLTVAELQQALIKSQLAREQLKADNAALLAKLKERDSASRTGPDHPPPPAAPLSATLSYLEGCPRHDTLGLPIINPIHLVDWADKNAVACSALLGKVLSPHHTQADLRDLLSGEIMAEDGPFEGGRAYIFSQRYLASIECTADEAIAMHKHTLTNGSGTAIAKNLKGVISTWRQGILQPILLRNVMYHSKCATTFVIGCHMLVVAQMSETPDSPRCDGHEQIRQTLPRDKAQHLCMLTHMEPDLDILDPRIWAGAMRDHMALKYVPAMVTTCNEAGSVLSQNAASLACIGVHGADQLLTNLASDSLPAYSQNHTMSYLLELLGSQELMHSALSQVGREGTFRRRVRVSSPKLLGFMQLPPNAHVYHDVSISRLRDGVTKQTIYIVAEMDVTSVVLAQRRVQKLQNQQKTLLKKILPQQVIDVLLEPKQPDDAVSSPGILSGPLDVTLDGLELDLAQQQPVMGPGHTSRTFSIPQLLVEQPSVPEYCNTTGYLEPEEGIQGDMQAVQGHTQVVQDSASAGQAPGLQANDVLDGPTTDGPAGNSNILTMIRTPSGLSSSGGAPHLSAADVQRLSTFHKSVSILFTDIQGFTSLSQTLHPSQVMLFLNELFSVFDSLLEEHDVYKVETIGDCYMVCAGLFDRTRHRRPSLLKSPSDLPGDPDLLQPADESMMQHNKVNDALLRDEEDEPSPVVGKKDVLGGHDPDHATKMLSFAKALVCAANAVLTPHGEPVKMRVGIHSGPIMTGVVGRRMPRFCCFGDTVNTASRMESTGTAGSIHASAAFQALTPHEPWQRTGGVEVKGKGHMETYIMHHALEWELE